MRKKLLLTLAGIVGLGLLCCLVIISMIPNLTITIRPMCPPPGYKDETGKHPFNWTQIEASEYPLETPEGVVLITLDETNISIKPQERVWLTKLDIQSNDVWRYFQFDVVGSLGSYGPVHVLTCVREGTFWLDPSEAKFRLWGQRDT